MKFSEASIASTPEILKRKLGGELCEPITIDFTDVTSGVVKAGSPISSSGVVANTADAVGILLNDVYSENPNGSIVKAFACVNITNSESNSGLTIAAAVKTALSHIVFE